MYDANLIYHLFHTISSSSVIFRGNLVIFVILIRSTKYLLRLQFIKHDQLVYRLWMIHHVNKSLHHEETSLHLWSFSKDTIRRRDHAIRPVVISSRTHHVHLTLPPSNAPSRVHEPFSFTHRHLLTLFTLPAGREKDGEGVAGWIREGRWNCQCCIGPPRVKTGHGSSVITSLPESLPADNGECALSSLFLSCHTNAVARTFYSLALSSSAPRRFCLIVPPQ